MEFHRAAKERRDAQRRLMRKDKKVYLLARDNSVLYVWSLLKFYRQRRFPQSQFEINAKARNAVRAFFPRVANTIN